MSQDTAAGEPLPIGPLFAWVSVQGNDGYGVISTKHPDWGWMPLITDDPMVAQRTAALAQKHADEFDVEVTLVRFGSAMPVISCRPHNDNTWPPSDP